MNNERPLLDTVTDILQALPHVSLQGEPRESLLTHSGSDVKMNATIHGHPVHLLIQAKNAGYPRDVRESAWHLRRLLGNDIGTPTIPLLIAPAFSDASKKLLRDEGIAYCDRGGSLFLETQWALYFIDRPPGRQERRPIGNIFQGKRTQVLHVLLAQPDKDWHITALAEAASMAASTVHEVLEVLEKELWVERHGRGPSAIRILREPGALLDAWAQRHSLKAYTPLSYYRFAPTPDRLRADMVHILERNNIDYALTLGSGAELTAPYLTHVEQLSFLVPKEISLADITATSLVPVEEGANVVFFLCRWQSPLLFRQRVGEIWIASNIQLYLDLFASPGRGREQAAHLRRERLSF